MINIQFLGSSNAVPGEEINERPVWYIPDYDKMIKNACCEAERAVLEENKKHNNKFQNRIVYTDCSPVETLNKKTGEREVEMKWELHSYPWYVKDDGNKYDKQQMINEIYKEYMKIED